MSDTGQVVVIAAAAASFTVACDHCAELDAAEGSTFAGRLDLDLQHGMFLCRRGHSVRIERAEPPHEQAAGAAATAA